MKILFTGLGSIGQRHLRLLRKLRHNQDEILAFRSRCKHIDVVLDDNMDMVEGESLTEMYTITEFEDLDDALSQNPDLVFVTNPTSLHVSTAIKSAKAGCNLFIEKPLSDSEEGIEELIKVVKNKNLVALVGYQQRFHTGILKIKTWLEEKRIGNIISARFENGEYLPKWHPYEDYRQSFAARKDLGGGVIFGINHELDYIIDLFGMPNRVFATAGNLSHLDVELEDSALVVAMYDVYAGTIPVTVNMDYLQYPPVKSGVIVGDQGRIIWDYIANNAKLIDRETGRVFDAWEDAEYKRNDMFVSQLNHLFQCLEGLKEPQVTIEDSRQSIKIALAARKSIETKTMIQL